MTSTLRAATPADIVRRLTGTPYAMTAETALAGGLGNAQYGITDAVDGAIAAGLVRVVTTRDTSYGRDVRFLALVAGAPDPHEGGMPQPIKITTAAASTVNRETIRVQVGAKVSTYPALLAEYGDHLAEGGEVRSLITFMTWAKLAFKTAPEWMTSFTAWVELDSSGLAYRVSTKDGRRYTIEGAAPAASGELLALYVA